MSVTFSPDILQSIKERLSFFEVASEFLQLKRSGRNYVGLCPFHGEKTPSFFVRDDEASYHCFGCGKKGSIFNFIMEMRGFSFPEAVRYLAKQANVTIPEEQLRQDPQQREQSDHQKFLRGIVSAVSAVFQNELSHCEFAREYFRSRKLSSETAAKFNLGYAPAEWQFLEGKVCDQLSAAADTEVSPEKVREALLELGLLKRKQSESGKAEDDRIYDSFRDRVIFPITRSDGRPIAFGGRTLKDEANVPKYINSSESPLYEKRRSFFGIFQALSSLRKTRHLYLVEGYMDVLSLHQIGIESVVATCGTAVTPEHATLLKRLVDGVSIVFDGDEAGQKAAAQCFQVFLNSGLDADVVVLPAEHDPDSLARSFSPADVADILEKGRVTLADAFLGYLLKSESGDSAPSPAMCGRIAQRYASLLAQVKNTVEREFLLRQGAAKLGVSLESLDVLVRDESRKAQGRRNFQSSHSTETHSGDSRSQGPNSQNERAAESRERPLQRRIMSGASGNSVEMLCRQLVISVLCEPSLADTILQLSDVQAQLGALDETGTLREQVFSFVREYRASECAGVAQLLAEAKVTSTTASVQAMAHVQAMLAAHDLGDLGLLEEAFRQCRIGGGAPQASVLESGPALERMNTQLEVRKLRERENHEEDEGTRLSIAQEKLEKKRSLDQIRAREAKPGPNSVRR